MQLSEQTQIEAQIGFTGGILVGALASWVFIIFFTPWEWYFKVFSSIGEIGIIGSLLLGLRQAVQARRNFIEVQAEMKNMAQATAAQIVQTEVIKIADDNAKVQTDERRSQ